MAQRILVVDDDRKITRVIQSYLEQAGMIVFVAHDGDSAIHQIKRERPDLIVLDLMLPGKSGWEVIAWLRGDTHLAATPVLMLTARVEDADKIHGLELGADDYVTKPFNPLELVARIKAILRRARAELSAPHILESGGLRLDLDGHTLLRDGEPVDLTPTEFALLRTLMQYPNRSFTRDELIEHALGYAYEGMGRTLDSHIKNLRKKIEADPSAPQWIETVFGVGYRFREERDGLA
ncbi:MAG TPA: response regulator transcription factor [Aggregatilineales bacterium]|nr:response regulator transcription factor [Aggregatilineales bacterium]